MSEALPDYEKAYRYRPSNPLYANGYAMAASLPFQAFTLASPARFELTTPGLGILCSILLSYGDRPSRI